MASPASIILPPGLHSARPAASIAGRLYYETDTNTMFRDNGTSWDNVEAASGGGGGGGTFSGAGVGISFASTATDNANSVMHFDQEIYDTDSYVDLGTNDDRITVPTGLGGTFLFNVVLVGTYVSGTDRPFAWVNRNNGSVNQIYSGAGLADDAGYTLFNFSGILVLSAGDYVTLNVRQHSGSDQNFGSASGAEVVFSLTRLG